MVLYCIDGNSHSLRAGLFGSEGRKTAFCKFSRCFDCLCAIFGGSGPDGALSVYGSEGYMVFSSRCTDYADLVCDFMDQCVST